MKHLHNVIVVPRCPLTAEFSVQVRAGCSKVKQVRGGETSETRDTSPEAEPEPGPDPSVLASLRCCSLRNTPQASHEVWIHAADEIKHRHTHSVIHVTYILPLGIDFNFPSAGLRCPQLQMNTITHYELRVWASR